MGKLEIEVDAKSPADKIWAAIKDTKTLLPKIFPETFKSIDITEGDGMSIGSVFYVKYTEGTPVVTFGKEKIEMVDESTKSIAYSIIDGELATFYKNLKASFQVIPKGDGSLVKWSLEYEKASDEVPDPSQVQDVATKTLMGLDEYLLKA